MFTGPQTVTSVTLLDIDDNEAATAEVFVDGGGTVAVPFDTKGDNSLQTLPVGVSDAVAMHVYLNSSGSLGEVELCSEGLEPPPYCIQDSDCLRGQICSRRACVFP